MKELNEKLHKSMGRARDIRKRILHSDLPEKDRLELADELLFLGDDLQKLQTLFLAEVQRIWDHAIFSQRFGWPWLF